jgi:anti-sigma regulatory factor (Ser/Thr protein kinase)
MSSHPSFLPVVRATVDGLVKTYGLSNEECIGVILAVDEAVANVIRHAYKQRHDKTIEFECLVDDRQMEFTLLDQGEAPDPARICAQPMDDIALCGRGTHLIRTVMDEVTYSQVSEGNQLKLVKRLHASRGRGSRFEPAKEANGTAS